MRKLQGWNKVTTPSAWGADWDYIWYSRSYHHTLYPYLCCLQEASIVTIPSFQTSCSHELDQNLQLSYHVRSHYLFARAYDNLILVVNGNEVWFMRWTSLEHMDLISISCRLCVIFLFQECRCCQDRWRWTLFYFPFSFLFYFTFLFFSLFYF